MKMIPKRLDLFIRLTCICLFVAATTVMPGEASAARVVKLPRHHKTIVVKGKTYHYHKGKYYSKRHSGYVAVTPPKGAVIAVLPVGFATVVIGGKTYFRHSGVYYQKGPSGYVVVTKPAGVVAVHPAPAPYPPAVVPPKERDSGSVSVSASVLNVRSGPGKKYPVIGQVYSGNALTIHGKAPLWIYVQLSSGEYGWVMKKFTRYYYPPASG